MFYKSPFFYGMPFASGKGIIITYVVMCLIGY